MFAALRLSGALLPVCASCASEAPPADFQDPAPSARMGAIVRAAQAGDREALLRLVEQLDSDDAAVRLAAISALERLTGDTLGYRTLGAEPDRKAAVDRWVQEAGGRRPDADG